MIELCQKIAPESIVNLVQQFEKDYDTIKKLQRSRYTR